MASDNAHSDEPAPSGLLLWDMAGTLVFFDPVAGKPVALPGSPRSTSTFPNWHATSSMS